MFSYEREQEIKEIMSLLLNLRVSFELWRACQNKFETKMYLFKSFKKQELEQ